MAETGKIFNTLEFGNVNSGDYGVYITGTGVYNAPARAVEMVSVPGRNGDVPIDMGHWDNIEVRYKCGLFGIDQSEMGEALMKFRNAIASQIGYQRLSDSYNPNEFRLGLFMAGFEFDAVSMNRAGEFELKFNCKPQRFLTDGEEMIDVKSDWSNLKTASDEVVTFEVEDDAAANYTQFKSLVADINPIQDLHGYDKPWTGGTGANQWDEEWELGGIDATTGQNFVSNYMIRSTNYIPVKGGETYRVYIGGSTSLWLAVLTYDADKNFLATAGGKVGGATFTVDSNVAYIRFYLTSNYGTTYKNDIAINYPSTVTTYSPYSNLCPISGWDSVEASVVGKNRWNPNLILTIGGTITESDGVYYFPRHFDNVPRRMWENTRGYVGQVVLSYDTMHGGNDGGDATLFQFMYTDGTITRPSDYSNSQPNVWRKVVVVSDPNKTVASVAYGYYRSNRESWIKNPQIELGTEATAYEPYQGTTHTATFDETVYGGTVDLVSGVLTIDRAMVDLGTRDYVLRNNTSARQAWNTTISGIKELASSAEVIGAISSAFVAVANNATWEAGVMSAGGANTNTVVFCVESNKYATAAEFKTAMNGVRLVYELAEPRTIQLSPQTITTLEGENNVWADSGDVSVEYGVRPGVLVNPTQYESSPVIEMGGTGDVSLNDYVIAIDDSVVGEVELADQRSIQPLVSSRGALTETIDMAETLPLLASGDSFRLSSMVLTTRWNASSIYTYTVSEQPTDGTAAIEAASLANNLLVVARINPLTFTKGTAQSYTEVFEVTRTVSNPGGSSGSGSIAFTTVVSYDGASTLSITRTFTVAGTYIPLVEDDYGTIGAVIGISSIPAFTGTVIIDSEAGDAYRIEDGTYISLNKYIQLGAQLPTLRPGANIITYDDTITSLKIAPRWWRL